MLFDRILKTAHESGGEVLIQLKNHCCDQYKGRILDLREDAFSLFHSGPGGGVLWAFKREDIAFCGLIVELPTPLNDEPEDSFPRKRDVPSTRRHEGGE